MFGATASVHRMCVACLTHSVVFGEKNCCNWKKNNNSESFVSISLILFYLFANFLFLLTFVAIDLLQLCLLPIQCYQIKTLFFIRLHRQCSVFVLNCVRVLVHIVLNGQKSLAAEITQPWFSWICHWFGMWLAIAFHIFPLLLLQF